MLNKFIKELLEKHNRVIVPDLGAFLHKTDSPDVIYFNEFLRFNDGLLVDYYAEKENIDKIEAAKKIKSLVDNINKELQTKKIFQLEGIGTLIVDSSEKIQLKSDPAKSKAESESISKSTPAENVASSSVKGKKDKSTNEREIELDTTPIEEKTIKKGTAKKTDVKPVPEPEIKVDTTFKEPEKPQYQKQTPTIPPNYMTESSTTYENRSNKKIIWLFVILFILGFLAAGYFLYFKKYFTDTSINQNKPVFQDTNVIMPKPKTEEIIPTVSEDKDIKLATGKYYIISGCFVQKNNADKFVKILNNKGYSSEIIGKIDELYFVSIGGYNTQDEAFRELRKIKPEIGINIWVKKY